MIAKKLVSLMSVSVFVFSPFSLISRTFPGLSSVKQITKVKKKSEMNPMLQDLQPSLVWYYFDQICKIPRPSEHEQELANYILDVALAHGLQGFQDSAGNVVVKKTASNNAYQTAPIVVLQSHMDMVTEKDMGIEHDFFKDSIKLVRDGKYLGAAGTTLGADNGIGVATMLALMSSSEVLHGPLEFLFTVEEESGFGGARNVTPASLEGRIFLNLDTEQYGDIYVGCAGGCIVEGTMPVTYEFLENNYQYFQLSINGCKGGHSGVDIHLGRAHAIKILAQFLELLECYQGRLAAINGGNKHNAIPRDAQAVVAIPGLESGQFIQAFIAHVASIKKAYSQEREMALEIKTVGGSQPVMRKKDQDALINLLITIPQGVMAMSPDIDGLVETSTHLARIESTEDSIKILTSQRSLVEAEKEKIAQRIVACLRGAGAQTTMLSSYPGWKPNLASPLLHAVQETYQKFFGQRAVPKAIHAGLECGEIGQQIPDMDMISFGPTIINAHSPSEKVDVETVQPFWNFLTALLQDLAEQHIQPVTKQPEKTVTLQL